MQHSNCYRAVYVELLCTYTVWFGLAECLPARDRPNARQRLTVPCPKTNCSADCSLMVKYQTRYVRGKVPVRGGAMSDSESRRGVLSRIGDLAVDAVEGRKRVALLL